MYIYKTTNQVNKKVYIGKSEKDVSENPDYLGSGILLKKALTKYGRNNFIKDILFITDDVDLLNETEIAYISCYKGKFGLQCYNLAEGGQGGNSLRFYTEEQLDDYKNKMSDLLKGENNPFFGKNHSEEAKTKISETKKGSSYSDDFKRKCSERMIGNTINLGRKQSEEIIKLKQELFSGEGNPMYGKTHSEETLEKISINIRKSKKIKFTCEHCGKDIDKGNFNRWHGDNCKKNPNITEEQLKKREPWNKTN